MATTAETKAGTETTHVARTSTLRCEFCASWNRVDMARAADRPKCGKCGKPMLLDRPIHLDDESFARAIAEAQVPVIVDFYADWCGPCKMMAPAVDQLAASYLGKAIVAKVDTEAAPKTSMSFQIRAIPTTVVFVNGKEAARQSGAVSYATLASMIDRAAASG